MSLRTLRFGDRTISYETGLNLSHLSSSNRDPELSSNRLTKVRVVDIPRDDDGIGTSDDETNSNTSSVASPPSDQKNAENASQVQPVPAAKSESESTTRRLIKPDLSAIQRLLAFDEEDEEDDAAGDEDEDDDDDDDDDEQQQQQQQLKKEDLPKSSRDFNHGWHRTIAKDLANLAVNKASATPSSEEAVGGCSLVRRHSINLCESRRPRKSFSSLCLRPPGGDLSSGPMSLNQGLSRKLSSASMYPETVTQVRGDEAATTKESRLGMSDLRMRTCDTLEEEFDSHNAALKTLNLRLDEVAHIRSALTKASLETFTIDTRVRQDIQRGKLCFVCMKTKFGLFSRGQRCEMCKQMVCSKCYSKMKIPLEHFRTTPVFALSPMTTSDETWPTDNSGGGGPMSLMSSMSSSMSSSSSSSSNCREKKISLPDSLSLLMNSLQSVGSEPNSPPASRKNYAVGPVHAAPPEPATISTISGSLANLGMDSNSSLPPQYRISCQDAFPTLPKNSSSSKSRRMSWIPSSETTRANLGGAPLTVCGDCKDMVVQVIRVSGSTRRLQQSARSSFLSLTPDIFREQRS